MILTDSRTGAVTTLPGDRTAFTIDMGAKAFKTLVDGLYSDKVGSPLREVMSNAYDAQIAAGNTDRPFLVTLPTALDPIVRVRDYGTGMTDPEARDCYTRLFYSTKDHSNEQVGAFGLGSKSPLAYGDTFTVRAFSGTEENVYTVTTAASGVPELISVGMNIPSTEERGIEVSYPVRHHDVAEFTRAAQKLIYGFPVAPIIDGPALARVEPLLAGDGWELYDSTAKALAGYNLWIRIGCAIYPANTSHGYVSVGHGNIVLIDAPIGSVQITPSRESLSYDDSTKHNQRALAKQVTDLLKQAVAAKIAEAKTALEKARAAAVWGPIINTHVGSTTVKLMPEIIVHSGVGARRWRNTEFPAGYLRTISSSRSKSIEVVTGIEYRTISTMKVVVDDGTKVLRRQLRLSAVARGGYFRQTRSLYLLKDDASGRARRRLQRILGMTDNQFVTLADLPDVPVVRAPRTPGGTAAAKPKWVAGTPWVARERTTLFPVVTFSRSTFQGTGLASDRVITWMARKIGFDMGTIRSLTPSEVKRLSPDPADEVTTMLLREFMASSYYQTAVPDIGTQVGLEQSHDLRMGAEQTYKLLFPGKAPWEREAHSYLRVVLSRIPLTDPVKRVYDDNVTRGSKALEGYPMLREPTETEIQEYVKMVNSTRKGHKP